MELNQKVKEAVKIIKKKKAQDIVVLDVSELSSLGENFIIASGSSSTQVKALADEVMEQMKKKGIDLLYPQQGDGQAHWILLDYGDVMIHIFYNQTRDFYALEKLWGDAKSLDIDEILNS